MSRRLIIVLSIISFLVLLGIGYVIFSRISSSRNGDTNPDDSPLFPFGQNDPTITDTNGVGVGVGDTTVGTTIPAAPSSKKLPKLLRISSRPISGYELLTTQHEELETITTTISVTDPETGELITEPISKDVITRTQTPVIRYHDRSNSNLYQIELWQGSPEKNIAVTDVIQNTNMRIAEDGTILFTYPMSSIDTGSPLYRARMVSTLDTIECPFEFSERLTLGATGRAVEQVQAALQSALREQAVGVEAGIFDTATEQLVIRFQNQFKLKPDGIVGRGTNALLTTQCRERERLAFSQADTIGEKLPYTLRSEVFPQPILDAVLNPNGTQLFSLLDSRSTVTGVVSLPNGSNGKLVYDLPFSDWVLDWPADTLIALTTKASGYVPGALYTIDALTGTFSKVWGGQLGLTTQMNPRGTSVLYSRMTNATFEFGIYTLSNQTAKPLSIKTFPEKCVWSQDAIHAYCAVPETFLNGGTYPDDWYQGRVQFRDRLWSINTATGEARTLSDLEDMGEVVDILDMRLSSDEKYLFFVNDSTRELWSYRLVD